MSHRSLNLAPRRLKLFRFVIGFLFCASVLCNHSQKACAAGTPGTGNQADSVLNHVASSSPNLNKLPLSFEINAGQTSSEVEFLSRGPGYSLFLTRSGAVIRFSDVAGNLVLGMNQQ